MNEHQFDLSISLGDYAHQVIYQNFHKVVDREKFVFKDKEI